MRRGRWHGDEKGRREESGEEREERRERDEGQSWKERPWEGRRRIVTVASTEGRRWW